VELDKFWAKYLIGIGVCAYFEIEQRYQSNKLCGMPPQYAPATCKLTFDL